MLLLSGCDAGRLGFLAPRGPVAAEDRWLFIVVVSLMAIVVVPVLVATPLLAWRYRHGNAAAMYRPKWDFSWALEVLIWAVPTAIVLCLAVIVWRETQRLDPYRAIAADKPPLEVEAVGLDWKWLFIYPELHVASVNELAFPADRPVHLTLTSDTVMQSLLVPQLAGQIYVMAGMRSQLNLKADAPGRFIGENTQFNGLGFQVETFKAVALSPEGFARWLDQVRAARTTLGPDSYRKLSRPSLPDAPVHFSNVDDGLFARIIDRYRGHGMSQ
jgi:cytochrome o ubiquinol oxidase subunit 2